MSMIITCPNCATGFKVSEAVFANGARKVRCAECSHSWMQELPAAETGVDDPLDDILSEAPPAISQDGEEDDADEFDVEMPEFEHAENEEHPEQDNDSEDITDNDDADMDEITPISFLDDIESEARQGPGETAKNTKSAPSQLRRRLVPMAAAACLALLAGSSVYFRSAISSYIPALAPVYGAIGLPVNLLGIEFAGISLKQKYENGFPVLSVEGEVINISSRQRRIPDVRLALQGPKGTEIYHWSINIGRAAIEPEQRVKFTTRLASPPQEASKIEIRFNTPERRMGAL